MNKPLGTLAGVSLALGVLCGPCTGQRNSSCSRCRERPPPLHRLLPTAVTSSDSSAINLGGMGSSARGDGTFTTFDVPGANGPRFPTAMNLDGTVVGWYIVQTDTGTAPARVYSRRPMARSRNFRL